LKIKELRIENLRNLVDVSLQPHQDLNIIIGDNGAGKTAIIESLVVLSRGRSFRTHQASELIGPDKGSFRVFAEAVRDDGRVHRLGLERSGKLWRARKDSKDLSQISKLTRSLPLILIEPNSHLLVSGAPEYRRKFLDWGVFHVEHGFLETYRRFTRVLKQRNAALRQKQNEVLDSLDSLIYPLVIQLDAQRKAHCQSVSKELNTLLQILSPELKEVKVEYMKGWGDGDYAEALYESRESDMDRGATKLGPHRADVVLSQGKVPARSILSRGEQKMVSSALLLAQATLLSSLGEPPVILLDDLASEFDKNHFDNVLDASLERGGQVWVTGTQMQLPTGEKKVFHVKHGIVQEVL
jgi:DNA replication and repair protein RecF